MTYEEIQPYSYENQPVEKGRQFLKKNPVQPSYFFRMRLISAPEKITSQRRYPTNLVKLAGVVFHREC